MSKRFGLLYQHRSWHQYGLHSTVGYWWKSKEYHLRVLNWIKWRVYFFHQYFFKFFLSLISYINFFHQNHLIFFCKTDYTLRKNFVSSAMTIKHCQFSMGYYHYYTFLSEQLKVRNGFLKNKYSVKALRQ